MADAEFARFTRIFTANSHQIASQMVVQVNFDEIPCWWT